MSPVSIEVTTWLALFGGSVKCGNLDEARRLRISDDSFMNVVNRRKADTWTKTNVVTHIDHVLQTDAWQKPAS